MSQFAIGNIPARVSDLQDTTGKSAVLRDRVGILPGDISISGARFIGLNADTLLANKQAPYASVGSFVDDAGASWVIGSGAVSFIPRGDYDWPCLRLGVNVNTNGYLSSSVSYSNRGITIVAVLDINALTSGNGIIFDSSGNFILGFTTNGGFQFYQGALSTSGSTRIASLQPGIHVILITIDSSGNTTFRVDGVSSGAIASAQSAATQTSIVLGNDGSLGTTPASPMDVYQFHLYSSVLTTTQLQNIESSLMAKYQPRRMAKGGKRFIFDGDSRTYGILATTSETAWPYLVGEALGAQVVDIGVPGATLAAYYTTPGTSLPPYIDSGTETCALVSTFGINDVNSNYTSSQFLTDLGTYITNAYAAGIKQVFVGTICDDGTTGTQATTLAAINAAIRELTTIDGVIDFSSDPGIADAYQNAFSADSLHFNDGGQRRWAAIAMGQLLPFVRTQHRNLYSMVQATPSGNTIANTTTETAFASQYTLPKNGLKIRRVLRVKAAGIYSADASSNGTTTIKLYVGGVLMNTFGAVTNTASAASYGWNLESEMTILSDDPPARSVGLTSGSETATTVNTDDLMVGMGVSGTGIAGGTTITAITARTSITLSANATATGNETLSFTGMVDAQGSGMFGSSISAGSVMISENASPIALDTSLLNLVKLSQTFSIANSNDSITLKKFIVELDGF